MSAPAITLTPLSPETLSARGAGLALTWASVDSPFGTAVLVAAPQGLTGLGFADAQGEEAALADLVDRWPGATLERDTGDLAARGRAVFTPSSWEDAEPFALALIGSPFELSVWAALAEIPLGTLTTYGALARSLGMPSAARAVGRAVGRNPVSFLIPCHRAVGASGALTGYHWGLERKKAMLAWEAGLPPLKRTA